MDWALVVFSHITLHKEQGIVYRASGCRPFPHIKMLRAVMFHLQLLTWHLCTLQTDNRSQCFSLRSKTHSVIHHLYCVIPLNLYFTFHKCWICWFSGFALRSINLQQYAALFFLTVSFIRLPCVWMPQIWVSPLAFTTPSPQPLPLP